MRKTIMALTCILALASCQGGKDTEKSEQERDSLMQVIGQKDEELNELVGSINEIQEGFQRINEAEGRITVASGNPENTSSREAIRENLEYIQNTMQENKNLIAQLQQKLNTSSTNLTQLRKTLETLQKELEEKNAHIQELTAALVEKDSLLLAQGETIEDLNQSVNSLTEDNKRKTETVTAQDKELNKAWFVFGTKSELKEQKILEHNDVLKDNNFNKNYFTEIDIRTMREIKLYSKKAEMLTSHPSGSYQLTKDQKGEYVLDITEPKKFWSVSKFLVILVK